MLTRFFFPLLLCALLAGGLTACGGGSDTAGDNSSDGGTNGGGTDDGGTDDGGTDDGGTDDGGTDDGGTDDGGTDDGGTDDPDPVVIDHGENLSYPLAYNKSGTLLVMGNRNNVLQVRSALSNDLAQTVTSSHGWTQALAASDTGSLFASGGRNLNIYLWSGNGSELNYLGKMTAPSQVRALDFNGSSELASAHEDGKLYLWDVSSRKNTKTLSGHTGRVYDLAYLGDGSRLVSAGGDGSIKLWDTATGTLIKEIGRHQGAAYHLAVAADGDSFFTAGEDGQIQRWSASNYSLLETLSGDGAALTALTVSSDGQSLLAGDVDGNIFLWNLASSARNLAERSLKKRFRTTGSGQIHSLAVNPLDQQFSSTSEDAVWRLWSTTSSSPLRSQSLLDNYTSPPPPPDTTQETAEALMALAFKGMQPVFNAAKLLEQPKTLEPYFLVGFLDETGVACPDSGSMDYLLEEPVENRKFDQPGDQFDVTLHACADTARTTDGAYNLTFNSSSSLDSEVEGTLSALRIQDGTESNELAGHVLFALTEADYSSINPQSVIQTTSNDFNINMSTAGNILFSALDSTLNKDEVSNVRSLLYTATLAIGGGSHNGSYQVEILEALTLDPAGQYPRAGKLSLKVLSGAYNGMRVTATVQDVDKVLVETDRTDNGSVDYHSTVNWQELSTPFDL